MNLMHLYCRVSSDGQVQRGSLDNQIVWAQQSWEQILAKPQYARFAKGQLFVDEGESAYFIPLLERTAGRQLDAILQRGDAILLANGDRGFRQALDRHATKAELARRGVFIIMADMADLDPDDPTTELMQSIRVDVAQWESAMKSRRIKNGLGVCKARNQALGRQALRNEARRPGWSLVLVNFPVAGPLAASEGQKHRRRPGRYIWVPNPDEFPILEQIYDLRQQGQEWRHICRQIFANTGDDWWYPPVFGNKRSATNGGRNCRYAYLTWQKIFLPAIAAYGRVERVQSLSRKELFAADEECQRVPGRGPRKKRMGKIRPAEVRSA